MITKFDCAPGCPVQTTLQFIDGKWKSVILYHLSTQTLRFSDLQRKLPYVSRRMLARQLSELVTDNVISKEIYETVPIRTEYSLTNFGKTLLPIVNSMVTWGNKYNELHK
ncbi:winged helix-turn-helix transcriptional regulator [Leuconostoc pseudomesenteroides]|uniref:winged helix-turn-helix transcriptional regulator n=1 Tax=Leuconostoc pseudomesenteroides TaxID=33968 RepID=UPI0039EC3E94